MSLTVLVLKEALGECHFFSVEKSPVLFSVTSKATGAGHPKYHPGDNNVTVYTGAESLIAGDGGRQAMMMSDGGGRGDRNGIRKR